MKFSLNNEFVDYYDSVWLPKDSYFHVHRKRVLTSWNYLNSYLSSLGVRLSDKPGLMYDVGGNGPICEFIVENYGWEAGWIDTDLRQGLPFEDDKFDLILCCEVIEHIKDLDSTKICDLESFNYSGMLSLLNEIRRISKTTATIFLTTPNANSYVTLIKWLNSDVLLFDPNHVREFSIKDLLRITEECGFKCHQIDTLDTWDEHFPQAVNQSKKLLSILPQSSLMNREDNIFAVFSKI